jgi:hypothetical protein
LLSETIQIESIKLNINLIIKKEKKAQEKRKLKISLGWLTMDGYSRYL